MISFEYGEGRAIVKENVTLDEEKGKEENAERQRQTQQKKSLGMIPDSHLSVDAGSDAGILKVNLPNYTDYSQRTLTVYHLSGIQQTSLTLNDAFSTIDLRHLPRGTYVAVLTLDGERETKKICLKTSWHIKLHDNPSSEKKVYPLFGEGGRKPYLCREMKRLVYIFVLLFLLSACTDDRRVLSLLDRAEALMEASPDSASRLLHAADSTIAQQSEPTRMRHAVLLAEANNKLYLPLPSDTIFQEVVDYYDRHGTPNQQLRAHYLLGCIYRDRNEAPQALQCYYDAIEKADTLSEDCDYMTLYKVYGQMAELYDWQYLPEEEIEALKEYSKNAHKAGDTYNYIRGIELQVKPYYMMDEKEKVLEITEKSHQLYVDAGMPQAAASVYPTAIHIYVSDSNYQEAYRLMKIFENRSELFDCQGNICAGREYYYYSKGNFYLGIGETDSAEYYYRRLLLYGYEYEANKGLLSVYQNMRQTDSITKYALLCEEGLGKMLEDNQAQSLLRLSQSYNYTRYQKIAAEKEKAAEKERLLKWLVLFTCCLIGLFLYYQYLIYRKKKTAELRKLETEKLNAITQLMEKNEEIILLKSSNDNIRKHLLATKQAEIDSLVAQIEEYKSQSNIINNKEKENALLASDKVKAFRNMTIPKLHQQLLPSESDWEQLIALTQDSLPLFYQKIAGEIKLTKQEIRTAILTRLDFTSGEIAVLLSTSPQRVTNIKERINLKLFGEKSATGVTKNLKNLKGVKQV